MFRKLEKRAVCFSFGIIIGHSSDVAGHVSPLVMKQCSRSYRQHLQKCEHYL